MDKVRDYQGRIPNYVIDGERLIHQPSGKWVQLQNRTPKAINHAKAEIRKLRRGT